MVGVLYFSWRATLVCFAFARPRPMVMTPLVLSGASLGNENAPWAFKSSQYVFLYDTIA